MRKRETGLRRRVATAAAVVALTAGSGACRRQETVRLVFRPRPGAAFDYRVTVHTSTVTRLSGQPPQTSSDDLTLDEHEQVLAVDGQGTTVAVRVTDSQAQRDFVVRLDGQSQLTSVQQVESLPSAELGRFGLAEIFPPAAGAPPDRPLKTGTGWRIDQVVDLPGLDRARLVGTGRLDGLGRAAGRRVATLTATLDLPLSGAAPAPPGIVLTGTERTRSRTTRSLGDGAVEGVTAASTADLVISLPSGGTVGTLHLEVRSVTRRLR